MFGISGAVFADDITIDFLGGAGGSISYSNQNSPLVGSNINISRVQGHGTPLHNTAEEIAMHPQYADGSFDVVNGSLNFETGAYSGYSADGAYLFSGGGHFTITGAIRNHSGGDIIPDSSTVLLVGYLLGAEVDRVGRIKLSIVNGTDTKHPDLISWFGLPLDTMFRFSGEIMAGRQWMTTGGYPVLESRITNTVVPEPATITLLGSIIFLIGTKLRRRLR